MGLGNIKSINKIQVVGQQVGESARTTKEDEPNQKAGFLHAIEITLQ